MGPHRSPTWLAAARASRSTLASAALSGRPCWSAKNAEVVDNYRQRLKRAERAEALRPSLEAHRQA
ncbi:MAG: hypothetical protein ACKOOC_03610, partial [Cyanobium sp.]